jgi:hypothetical protein
LTNPDIPSFPQFYNKVTFYKFKYNLTLIFPLRGICITEKLFFETLNEFLTCTTEKEADRFVLVFVFFPNYLGNSIKQTLPRELNLVGKAE